MARNGSGVYSLPAGSTVTNGDTSDATDVNTPLADLEQDANTARPVVAGGTGVASALDAMNAFGAADATVTGDWTVSGAWTFSANPLIENSAPVIDIRDSDGVATALSKISSNAAGSLRLRSDPNNITGSSQLEFEVDGSRIADMVPTGMNLTGDLAVTGDIEVSGSDLLTLLATASKVVAEASVTGVGVMSDDSGFASCSADGTGAASYRYTFVFTTEEADTAYHVSAIHTNNDGSRSPYLLSKSTTGFELAWHTASNDRDQLAFDIKVTRRGL